MAIDTHVCSAGELHVAVRASCSYSRVVGQDLLHRGGLARDHGVVVVVVSHVNRYWDVSIDRFSHLIHFDACNCNHFAIKPFDDVVWQWVGC